MANLSNINGKFVVEQTTGYVGVGTTDPNFLIEAAGANSEIALNSTSASIYRLRSTSSDSFIITKNGVGDRLVIAGNGDATFTGGVTAPYYQATNFINVQVDDAEVYWTNTANNDYWRWKRDASNNFILDHYNGSSSTEALGFSNIQNATFAGNIATLADKRISVGTWSNSAFTGGNAYGFSVTSSLPLLHLTESDQTNKKAYVGLSGGSMYVGGLISNLYLQTGTSGTTALSIDSSQNATFAGTLQFSGGVARLVDNQLQSGFNQNVENADFWINYQGYQGGTTRYRDFRIGDGKQNQIAFFDGSTGYSTFTGNVGIATTTPQKKLHIEGTGGASEMQILVSSASDTVGHTAGIGLRGEGGEADGDFRIKGGIFFERIAGSFGNGKMILAVNSSVSNTSVTVADHALTIDTNKNVGIGTTSPAQKLTVNGNIGFTGLLGQGSIYGNTGNASYAEMQLYNPATGYTTIDNRAYGYYFATAGSTKVTILNNGKVGIGITSPNTKLDVSGATGTRNRNTQGSSVYETSLYFNAAGNATTNISINTTTAFPPIASGGFILVEVSASGYGNSGSNGLVFSYISGGYGGHYGGQGQPYHPVEIIANTMQAGSCTFYYPNSTTIGIAVTTTNSVGLNGLMRVKVTSTY